ncbi:MAG: pyridoxal-phosphate dependent enzyme [Bacteroidota bacterium]
MCRFDERTFWDQVYTHCSSELLYSTRIHPLPTFSSTSCNVFIKREDESGFGISGYKKRKFASLLPFLEQNEIEEVILIGGTYSNHIVGLLQLLNEKQISYQLVLKEPSNQKIQGNAFLLALLNRSQRIHWIPPSQWHGHLEFAQALVKNSQTFLIPEGGLCREAVPGMATLWKDIRTNEEMLGKTFNHIFIDAGTGLSAAVLQAVSSQSSPTPIIHVILMAEGDNAYKQVFKKVCTWLQDLRLMYTSPVFQAQLYRPYTAASFGSVNATVRKFCQKIAKEEGVLCDPVYSAKLLMQAQRVIQSGAIDGEVLIIHSGGGTGLMGFSDQFALRLP